MSTKELRMSRAELGTTVKVCYIGKLENGKVFDRSHSIHPIEFTIGDRRVVPGLEEAVIGMWPGESKTAVVPAARAYGPVRPDRFVTVKQDDIPDHVELSVGKPLRVPTTSGRMIDLTVEKISDTKVTFDANHPLAGNDLTFEVSLIEIAEHAHRDGKIHG